MIKPTRSSGKLTRAGRYVGAAAIVVLLLLVASPPARIAPLLPRFFFGLGVAFAYLVLVVAVLRLAGVTVPRAGEEFVTFALLLAGTGAGKALVIPLLLGALLVRLASLRAPVEGDGGR